MILRWSLLLGPGMHCVPTHRDMIGCCLPPPPLSPVTAPVDVNKQLRDNFIKACKYVHLSLSRPARLVCGWWLAAWGPRVFVCADRKSSWSSPPPSPPPRMLPPLLLHLHLLVRFVQSPVNRRERQHTAQSNRG